MRRPDDTTPDDEAADRVAEIGRAGRRRLLFGAASGFALTASGLLLPEWLIEEAEADSHPVRRVQHRADKRRQRKHHRLQQKRNQRQRGSGTGAPGAFIKGVRLKVVANYGPLHVDIRHGNITWSSGGRVTIQTGFSESYATGDLNLGALFETAFDTPPAPSDGNLFVWASNPVGTPDVTVQNGGRQSVDRQNMREGQSIRVAAALYQNVTVALVIERGRDSNDYKEFTLTVNPR